MSTKVDYRHHGVGLLRATARVVLPRRWPDPSDEYDCRSWLCEVWPEIAEAVEYASPTLAARVETILADAVLRAGDMRRVVLAVVRYVLRFSRSTPFGMFAGVGTVSVGTSTLVRVGRHHRPVVAADSRWLHQMVARLEKCEELLTQLEVRFNDAAMEHGGRLTLRGAKLVSIRSTLAVPMIRAEAASPMRFSTLVRKLADAFPNAGDPTRVLVSLLENGFLLTSLRAPSTVTDPLRFVLERLGDVVIDKLPIAPLVHDLQQLHDDIAAHNHDPSRRCRSRLAARMRRGVELNRVPFSVDLRLDAQVRLPHAVVREMERAASVLARLAREHTGTREWRDYFAAFCERYGTRTLVPLRMLVNPSAELGWPRGYPGSREPSARHTMSERDKLLLTLAAETTARGSREIELDAATIDRLIAAGGGGDSFPPHIDLGARVHATSRSALDRGQFTLTITPGRAAGTLTSRFASIVPDAGLATVFAELPTTVQGALPAQLSFPPIYPSAESVSRVPRYVRHLVSVGEHDSPEIDDTESIRVDDLAVTATKRRLHLVSLSRRQVVEPLVMHALALKHQPPVARLIGELSRALDVGWIGFDWGAADALPFCPRVRCGRAILSPARWRLTLDNLDADAWDENLGRWRAVWRCPSRVQLREYDQLLPLDLEVAAHRDVLYRHVRRHHDAVLVETPDADADGWLEGHAHTVVLPLTLRRQPEPGPRVDVLPVVTDDQSQLPGVAASPWVYAKLYLTENQINTLLVHQLPVLLDDLGHRSYWFVRYPQPREGEEPDHLRLRVGAAGDADKVMASIACWAAHLRSRGLLGRLAFDTYFPETGRYGALAEAEDVFVADSRFVLAQLTHLPTVDPSPTTVTALVMFDVAAAFLGGEELAADWLRVQGASASPGPPDRADVQSATELMRGTRWHDEIPGWADMVGPHRQLMDALGRYRRALSAGVDLDDVLHSLLHMHHNRAVGVDRERERICLRLARHAAAAWRTRHVDPI